MTAADVIKRAPREPALEPDAGARSAPRGAPRRRHAVTIDRAQAARSSGLALDVVFPVLHGPYGEDGTVQGLLELANVPYVGAGVLASAVGMDKAAMKLVFAAKGLPICDYEVVLKRDWQRDERARAADGRRRASASRCSSSRRTSDRASASRRPSTSRSCAPRSSSPPQFDRKIVVEAAVPQAREIEVAVLGNDEPEASVPGEIIPSREFYDYEAKYLRRRLARRDSRRRSTRRAPQEVRALAIAAFKAIDGAGMARVDFLLAGDSRRAVPQRGEHHSRLHDDQHVLEDVGGERSAVPAAARSPHRARDRTPRREAAAAHAACDARSRCIAKFFDFSCTFVLDTESSGS